MRNIANTIIYVNRERLFGVYGDLKHSFYGKSHFIFQAALAEIN